MMRTGCSSSMMVLFKTPGSRLKRLSHKPWEMSATLAALGRSSSGAKLRPRTGAMPSVGRKFCATAAHCKWNRVGLGQIALIHASLKGERSKRLLIISPFVIEATQHELLCRSRDCTNPTDTSRSSCA